MSTMTTYGDNNENTQYADNQSFGKVGLTTYGNLSLGTQKSVLCIVLINQFRKKFMSFSSGQTKQSIISGCPICIKPVSVERGATVV